MPVQPVKAVQPVKKVQSKSGLTNTKSIPVGVKVIAILYYIGAVISILAAIGLIVVMATVGSISGAIETAGAEQGLQLTDAIPGGAILSSIAIVGIIVMIALAVLLFFIGRGLWKGKSWTRIAVIIISAIGAVSAIVSIIGGEFGAIVSLIIHAIIGGYLLFSKTVKQAFA